MKKPTARDRLIVALDVPTAAQAIRWIKKLKGAVRTFKVGHELFTAEGPGVVKEINRLGCRVFLDLKFFDIPNTMAGAVTSTAKLKPFLTNIHALAGSAAMRACAESAKRAGGKTKLLAVTLLTSFTAQELRRSAIATPIEPTVSKLCKNALAAGMDGIVASPRETPQLRKTFGNDFIIVTPGVRPAWAAKNDQQRIATPRKAIRDGADYLVVGRPILNAENPVKAATMIVKEIEEAMS